MTAMTLSDRNPRKKNHRPILWTALALVLVAVIAVAAVPQLREMAKGVVGKVFGTAKEEPKILEENVISRFSAAGNEGQTAPADVVLTVQADKSIQDLRIASSEGGPYTQETSRIENDDTNVWTLTIHVTAGFNDIIRLEVSADKENWQETEYAVVVNVTAPVSAAEETAAPGEDGEPAESGEPAEDGEPAEVEEPGQEPAMDEYAMAEPWEPAEDGEPGEDAEPAGETLQELVQIAKEGAL